MRSGFCGTKRLRWERQWEARQRFVDRAGLQPPSRSDDELVREAGDDYLQLHSQPMGATGNATPQNDPRFLVCLCANSLHHRYTDYDQALRKLNTWDREEAKEGAVQVLRERMLQEIAAAYPEFGAECQGQQAGDSERGCFETRLTEISSASTNSVTVCVSVSFPDVEADNLHLGGINHRLSPLTSFSRRVLE